MKNKSTVIYIILAIVITVILGGILYFVLNSDTTRTSGKISENSIKNETSTAGEFLEKSIKEETLTADNYDEIINRIDQEFNKDDEEVYYLSYSIMYYIMKDGMASAMSGSEDESAMYVNIYGKTVQQLIDEGKQLMKENNITLEEYKEKIKDLDNTINN